MSETYWDVSIPFLAPGVDDDYYAPWGGPVEYTRAVANQQVHHAGVAVPEDLEPEIREDGRGANVARWRWFG